MERYVIVCLIKGPAYEFHEKIVSEVFSKFNIKRQKLPAHFTIKAPFETNNIKPIENLIEIFVKDKNKLEGIIEGISSFRENVIFMKIALPIEGIKLHDDFIDILKTIPNLEWKNNDGKNKTFHCTIATHIQRDQFKYIFEYVTMYNPFFKFNFDNITILKWDKYKWINYKEYNLK